MSKNSKEKNEENINFTPDAVVEAFVPGLFVELVGFVDAIESTKQYGNLRIFKFILNNSKKYRIQINAYDDDITRTEQEIKLGNVIHLENVRAAVNNKYNKGNFQGAQLTMHKYTII
ncbi:uncharacterized protein LOC123270552 isoform X2 [Cotesia glomerata]|uniref:Uncharacterized protein n=1 Tax=Cotesia glomerata TaxID=32391 RepID=A0AAV7ILC0_COTGL|nr:uncharacterized protein LOC123270552 isoform X2 [Cotesia glomerata]KAH0552510.1 hypothetical protein KQX54_011397 [Cotesia glomerata]